MEFINALFGGLSSGPLLWAILSIVAILLVLAAFALFRSLSSGVFIAGGKGRRQRLAVVDATAVDNKRRLVLVRRDGIEHLLLIGGHNDVVVESGIAVVTDASSERQGRSARTVEEVSGEPSASEPVARLKQVPQTKPEPVRQPPATRPVQLPAEQTQRGTPSGQPMPPPAAPQHRSPTSPQGSVAAQPSKPAAPAVVAASVAPVVTLPTILEPEPVAEAARPAPLMNATSSPKPTPIVFSRAIPTSSRQPEGQCPSQALKPCLGAR